MLPNEWETQLARISLINPRNIDLAREPYNIISEGYLANHPIKVLTFGLPYAEWRDGLHIEIVLTMGQDAIYPERFHAIIVQTGDDPIKVYLDGNYICTLDATSPYDVGHGYGTPLKKYVAFLMWDTLPIPPTPACIISFLTMGTLLEKFIPFLRLFRDKYLPQIVAYVYYKISQFLLRGV